MKTTYCNKAGFYDWSPNEVKFLLGHYWKKGWTVKKIANHLDRSINAVHSKKRRLVDFLEAHQTEFELFKKAMIGKEN